MKNCICTVLFLIAALACALPVEAVYDTWANRIEITLNNPGAAVTDYPVRVNIPAKTFISALRMNSDLRDIRFSDGANALPFWISMSEGMQRNINNMPVWVKLKTFSAGTNIIYMHFDKTKFKTDSPPKVDYTVGAAADYCGSTWDFGSPASPYSALTCGKNVFGLSGTSAVTGMFTYDCSDATANGWAADSSCIGNANKRWVSKNKFGSTSNAFDLYFRLHYSNGQSMTVYFLTQNSSAPAVASIDNYCGYKLVVDGSAAHSTANQTYNMGNVVLNLQKKTANCGSSSTGWATVFGGSYNWHPYDNSIQDFDIKVTSSTIGIDINGNTIGTYARGGDGWTTGGYVGFNRGSFTGDAEGGSNSTDGISPIWVIDKFLGSTPTAVLHGEADLAINKVRPAYDGDTSSHGQDVIEVIAQKQVVDDYVNGNTLEKYIYSAFPLASLETQVFMVSLTLRNRGNVSDTFTLQPTLTGDTSNWSLAYDPGSGLVNIPQGTSSPAPYTTSLAAGASTTLTYYVMPSNTALFEGGKGSNNMIIDFNLTANKDRSFDNVRYVAHMMGRSGCYWKWKMPIYITYTDSNHTGDLIDYQVLLDLSGLGAQFLDAQANGSDIIFTDSNGSYLPFWIKTDSSGNSTFNKSGGKGSFWVQVPRICSSWATPQGPSCTAPGQTTIYMWWGNSNYTTSLSDQKKTFDLWEDWGKMDTTHSWTLGKTVGCPLNKYLDPPTNSVLDPNWAPECDTNDEPNKSYDINSWLNNLIPSDQYDWWKIRTKLDENAVMADKQNWSTVDVGTVLSGGDIRWTSYEASYSFYDEYTNYSGGCAGYNPSASCSGSSSYGNPQYNPVYFQDAGNGWGIELFTDKFIFRPFGYGTDWTWTYQAHAGAMSGIGSPFPGSNKRYWVKTRLFQNPTDGTCSKPSYTDKASCETNSGIWTFRTHLRLQIASSTPADTDSDASFTEITPSGGFVSDPAFNISGGKIGFGGWNSGFSFDNIRVRKYTEPSPTYSPQTPTNPPFQPVVTLSSPNLTPPLMNHRPVLLSATVTPWAWTGNATAIYADCFISGDCKSGEVATQPGTISLWGSIDANHPKGFGDQLMAAVAGDNNRAAIDDSSWQRDGRYMFTAYDSNSDGRISCATTPADCLAFGINTANTTTPTLMSMMGLTTVTDAQNLVKFVRGQYVTGYPKSDTRNKCTSGPPYADTCQWKLADIIHSNPLVVGIPNMLYADTDYTTFANNNNNRDLVTYFGSNEGIFHASRMATYDAVAKQYTADAAATELWAFIPNAVLGNLGRTTDTFHEYMVDLKARAIDIKSGGVYKTVLMAGLRSGGQSFFAMDVTDPRAPQLMWEINSGTNNSQFLNTGKAWTAPALGRLCESTPCDANNTGNRWVAIVGSGFSPNDIDNLSKRAYLSIIDLQTGAFIKQIQISTKPGNITTDIAVTRDNNGYLQQIYFGDYYGAVWRVDLTRTSNVSTFLGLTSLSFSHMLFQPSDYTTSNINVTGAGPQRSVTSQPRIAYAGPNQLWVYFGTGFYDEYNARYPYQRFYGLQDGTTTYLDTSLVDMTLSTAANASKQSWFVELGHNDTADVQLSGVPVASCVSACLLQSADNTPDYCNSICNSTLATTKDRNERVLNTPEIFGGFIFFGTYTPINAPCANGNARFYALNYLTGATVPGLMMNASQQNVRSMQISSGGGIPSNPLIFTGRSSGGQIVAAGLMEISTGQMAKVMLNPNSFTDVLTILLWRQIK